MITPRAKNENYSGNRIKISDTLTVSVTDTLTEKVFKALEIFLKLVKIKLVATDKKADIELEVCEDLGDKPERYMVCTGESGIKLSFADFLGGRNAAATLYQLIRIENNTYYVLEAEIDDWADNKMRGVLLDPARRFIPPQELKDTFVRMALCKMNIAHLHLMDSPAYTLQSHTHPEINSEEFGFYKTEEMKEIVAFGKAIGVECLPEIEIPAHGFNLAERASFLKCETETVEPSIWVMCVGNEKVYDFYTDIINEIAEVFPYEIIHIGGDEVAMYDVVDVKRWPTWYDCKHCKAIAEKLGIYQTPASEVIKRDEEGTLKEKGVDGVEELYLYMVKRMYEIVTKAGKRMMMWNDCINIGKPVDLPRDILIHFWRVAAPFRGPRENCSMEAFLEQGFEIVNSHYAETYIEEDFYVPEVPLCSWGPKVYPESKKEFESKILGGWPAAWDNYPHFSYTLPSSLAFYCDRLWDESAADYGEDFCKSVTRLLLGPAIPDDFNVFAAVGGYFLPRTNPKNEPVYGYVDNVKISIDEITETEKILCKIANCETVQGKMAAEYAKCVKWVREKKAVK